MNETTVADGNDSPDDDEYPADMVSFIESRLLEDERIARFVESGSPNTDTPYCSWATTFDQVDPNRYIVAVDYQRVLAELAAKRRIITAFWEVWRSDASAYNAAADYMETVVRDLAAVHREHEDYRIEWCDASGT